MAKRELFIYSVDVYNHEEEVYSTHFGLVDSEEEAASLIDYEYMKNFKIIGKMPINQIVAAAHYFGKDELKRRFKVEY